MDWLAAQLYSMFDLETVCCAAFAIVVTGCAAGYDYWEKRKWKRQQETDGQSDKKESS